ncbi:hypothetical protein [Saccharopolyspora sp. NPDC002376]
MDDTGRQKHYYVNESVGIACGMFITALHTMGLATLPHTPNPMGFLTKILERPSSERPHILFPVGYPEDGPTAVYWHTSSWAPAVQADAEVPPRRTSASDRL